MTAISGSPVLAAIRIRAERRRKVIDLLVYGMTFASGVIGMVQPPHTILATLPAFMLWIWAGMLWLGGAAGFLGRMRGWWWTEMPGAVIAQIGILWYAIVLTGQALFGGITAGVVACICVIAFCYLLARLNDLKLFTTDPGVKTGILPLLGSITQRMSKGSSPH